MPDTVVPLKLLPEPQFGAHLFAASSAAIRNCRAEGAGAWIGGDAS
jgi:hypothetical protein